MHKVRAVGRVTHMQRARVMARATVGAWGDNGWLVLGGQRQGLDCNHKLTVIETEPALKITMS